MWTIRRRLRTTRIASLTRDALARALATAPAGDDARGVVARQRRDAR
jgi:hypothetical protein